ncbi:MAG: cell filamentation protein Fic, partial [Terrimicrobiaceae bacterium]
MNSRLKGVSLPDQQIVVSRDDNRVAVHRAVRAGRLRKLGPRIYSANFQDSPEKIVRANCWAIAGAIFPQALISDRTALEQRPAADGSIFLITESRSTDLELPGITFRPRPGPAPMEGYDMPFIAGLWMSSQARAFMDNLRSTRQRGRVRATLTRQELEEFIDKMLRNSGEVTLNKLRDQARAIAPQLKMEAEAEKLSAIIGAMRGTQEEPLSSDLAVSRSKGIGYDPDRLILFEDLRASLAS